MMLKWDTRRQMWDKSDQSKSTVGGDLFGGYMDNANALEEQTIHNDILHKDSTRNINAREDSGSDNSPDDDDAMGAQGEASDSDDPDDGVMETQIDESDLDNDQLKQCDTFQLNMRSSGKGNTLDEQKINKCEQTKPTAEEGERSLDNERAFDETPDEDPTGAILDTAGKDSGDKRSPEDVASASGDEMSPKDVATASGMQVDSNYLDNEPLPSSVSNDPVTTQRSSRLRKCASRRKLIVEDSESDVEMHEIHIVKKTKTVKGRDKSKPSTSSKSSKYDKSRFKCNFCDRAFTFKYLVERHKKRVHTKEKTHLCRHCSEGFYRAYDLKRHVLIAHKGYDDYVECHICSKRVKETSMKQHVQNMHSKDDHLKKKQRSPDRFQCDTCKRPFVFKYKLEQHKKRVHLKEKSYFCSQCTEGFYRSYDLKHHVAVAHKGYNEYVKCHVCSKSMKESSMRQHMSKMHHARGPSRKLSEENSSTDVQNSQEENTANNETTEKTQPPDKSKSRFQCDLCEKRFEFQYQVKKASEKSPFKGEDAFLSDMP